MTSITLNVNRERECDSWAGDKGALGTGVYYRLHRQCKIPDFAAFILSGQPGTDRKFIWTGFEYAGLHGNETVWDCGIGVSLSLAQKAKQVYGVRLSAGNRDAKETALNGIENAHFLGKSEEVLRSVMKTSKEHEW